MRKKLEEAEEAKGGRCLAYLRVSTVDQDLEKFRFQILEFANRMGMGKVEFLEEKVSGCLTWKKRKLAEVLGELEPGDRILTPELSRLGRSTLDVLELLELCTEKGVLVYDIKGNRVLNGTDAFGKVMTSMLAAFAELERDLISIRTKEALAASRAKGVRLGRPRGPGKSKLDEHAPEIEALLRNGSTKSFVARRYHSSPGNLCHWLKTNELNIQPEA